MQRVVAFCALFLFAAGIAFAQTGALGIDWSGEPTAYTDPNEDVDGTDSLLDDEFMDIKDLKQTSDPGRTYFYWNTYTYESNESAGESFPDPISEAAMYIYVDQDSNTATGNSGDSEGPIGADLMLFGPPWAEWGSGGAPTGATSTGVVLNTLRPYEVYEWSTLGWHSTGLQYNFAWQVENVGYWQDEAGDWWSSDYLWVEWELPNSLADPDGDGAFRWWAEYMDEEDYAPGDFYYGYGNTEDSFGDGVTGHTPEPATAGLMLLGIGALAALRRRKH